MKELTMEASLDNLEIIQSFVGKELENAGCSMKVQMQVELAVEEIYVNIAKYAYDPNVGNATVRCEVGGSPIQIVIQFMDEGIPFNPLEKKDADVTLSAEERQVGGLGIFIVKKSMDAVDYEYKDGKNILTIKKVL